MSIVRHSFPVHLPAGAESPLALVTDSDSAVGALAARSLAGAATPIVIGRVMKPAGELCHELEALGPRAIILATRHPAVVELLYNRYSGPIVNLGEHGPHASAASLACRHALAAHGVSAVALLGVSHARASLVALLRTAGVAVHLCDTPGCHAYVDQSGVTLHATLASQLAAAEDIVLVQDSPCLISAVAKTLDPGGRRLFLAGDVSGGLDLPGQFVVIVPELGPVVAGLTAPFAPPS